MQKPPQEHAPLGQGQVITPAPARRPDGAGTDELQGYAVHTGEARSMEDVTVRDGTAPIMERGEAEEEESEALLAHSIPESGNAPD